MVEQNLLDIIKSTSLFGRISSHADLCQLDRVAKIQYVNAGQTVMQEHQPVQEIAIITSGQVRVCFGGGSVDSLHLGVGSLFGEMEYFDPSPCMATVIAVRPTTLLCIRHEDLQRIADDNPMTGMQLYYGFLKTLTGKHKLVTDDLVNWKLDKSMDHLVHDLRSPLAALKCLNPAINKLPDSDREFYGLIVNRIENIADTLTKSGRRDALLGTTYHTIFQRIDGVVREKAHQYGAHADIHFAFVEIADLDTQYACDGTALGRIISNLLDNAVQSLGVDRGRLQVCLRRKSEALHITVQDNGRGFPAAILGKLGKEPATHGKVNGHGLGLFHAFRIVESWGGSMLVCSSEGCGSCVGITLRVIPRPAEFGREPDMTGRRTWRSQPLHTN